MNANPTGELGHYDPATLLESTTNPRKGKVDVSDLVDSVKAQGILEPLLGRSMPDGRIEIVFGRRRRAAALAAGLPVVPVVVRAIMTDEEALEAQIVENRDRRDVHPMEEAEGYESLLRMPKADGSPRSVEDVAARVGVTVSYLTRRLALLKLDPDARSAFGAGRIETSVALILATLRKADQKKAIAELAASEDGSRGAIPYRAALEHVRRTYLLRLADAPFSLSSEDLVPGVGACGACPKRTGSNPNLFGEFEATELCTDPTCHGKKVTAGWSRLRATAEGIGRRVLSDKEAGEVFKFGATTPASESGFVDLDDRCFEDPKERTFRAILGADLPPPILARDARGGVHDLLEKKTAQKAVRSALPKKAVEKAESDEAKTAEIAAAEHEEKVRSGTYCAAEAAILKKVEAALPPAALRVVAAVLLERARDTRKEWKIEAATQVETLSKMKGAEVASLVLSATMELAAFDPFMRGEPGPLDEIASAYRVDLKKIRAEQEKKSSNK